MPAAADVLSDAHPDRSGAAGSQAGNGLPEGDAIRMGRGNANAGPKRNPVFPAILSTAGQEVECQARITVSPSGGLLTWKLSAAQAILRLMPVSRQPSVTDLFSRVDGRKYEVETVRFHFRLERLD